MTEQFFTFICTALCISLFSSLSITAHIVNDDISIIRDRVLRLMVWPAQDDISITIQKAIGFNRTLNHTCYWPDINYADQHVQWITAEHMTRITTMLQALTVNGSTIRNDTTILASVHCALNVWLIKDFQNPFWWYNRIGTPLEATKQLLMLGNNVTNFEREKILEISYRADWWNGGSIPVGANLIWMIQVQLYRSLATTNLTGINQGFSKMWEDVTMKHLGGQGVVNDWSYHFHGSLLLSGSYGTVWASNVLLFLVCGYDTQYALKQNQTLFLAQAITKGYAWMIIGKQYDWLVVGREIDRVEAGFTAFFYVDSLRFLANIISVEDLKSDLNNLADRLEKRPNATLLIGNKHFYTTDYQAHRRPKWTSTIRMQSPRMDPVECFNGQNLKEEHGGQGVLNVYTTSTYDYQYIFPLLDWQAINGITVEHGIPLEPCSNGPYGLIKQPFVGGVSDGQYGMAMMNTATHNLTAQRSWHFYDDTIIALATNITLTTNSDAWTTLASRLLSSGHITLGFFNSTIVTLPSDGIYSFPYIQNASTNVQWIHVGQTNMGFILQQQSSYASLGIDIRMKEGNYITIGPSNHTVTERTLTIWIDHGKGPYTLDYNYMIIPQMSLETMSSIIKIYEEEQVFSCLSTSKLFHGTMWPKLQRASFVLWDNVSTTFSCKSSLFEVNIEVHDAGAYIYSENSTDFSITVSHPIRVNGTINLRVDRVGNGKGCVVSKDLNLFSTNVTVTLPSSSEWRGSSVSVSCKKQNVHTIRKALW